jgi:replicative DNA helicase
VQQAVNGVWTGFPELDKLTSGWLDSELIVVASRPGDGKTDFILNMVRHAALIQNKKACMFYLESNAESMMNRLIAAEANINKSRVISGDLTEEERQAVSNVTEAISSAQILINDMPNLTVPQMAGSIKHSHFTPDLIVVDHLGSAKGVSGQKRQKLTAEHVRQLKSMARQFNCPVILSYQLPSSMEDQKDKRPVLHDLKDSSEIEQAADKVIFLYAGAAGTLDKDKDTRNYEIIVAKHKNGPVGMTELAYFKETGAFAKPSVESEE